MARATIVFVVAIGSLLGADLRAQDRPFARGDQTRGLSGGAGIGYRPPWAPTRSDVAFGAFHPRLGWFAGDRLELFCEGTLLVYAEPGPAVSAGVGALAGRYYLRTAGRWLPYLVGGVGVLWTTLDAIEIDRTFNFQHVVGVGWQQHRRRGPRLTVELRSHHISNAGTAGDNLGVNALVASTGVEWVIRSRRR